MGNCICTPPSSNPNTTPSQPQQEPQIHVAVTPSEATTPASTPNKQRRRNKMVVKIQGDECGEGIESKAGGKGVRIRVVLTQQELKEILDEYHNGESKYSSSMEELLRSALKRRRSGRDCNKGHKGGWRPALHSIPEDA